MNFGRIVFAAALFSLSCACNTTKKQQQSMFPAFDKEGHRGCRGLMPENTIPAMLKALDIGVTTLEMDASITKDGKVILSHEPFFNHEITTKPGGAAVTLAEEKELNIYKMEYSETQRYDVGLRPHPRFPHQQKIAATKPLLESVIDSADAHAMATHRPLPFYNI
jgi:glycerophosphoryl diester phosphodiesterase